VSVENRPDSPQVPDGGRAKIPSRGLKGFSENGYSHRQSALGYIKRRSYLRRHLTGAVGLVIVSLILAAAVGAGARHTISVSTGVAEATKVPLAKTHQKPLTYVDVSVGIAPS
jgi:hypothetical protein